MQYLTTVIFLPGHWVLEELVDQVARVDQPEVAVSETHIPVEMRLELARMVGLEELAEQVDQEGLELAANLPCCIRMEALPQR